MTRPATPARRLADRAAAAVLPWVLMYGAGVLTDGVALEARLVELGVAVALVLAAAALVPRIRLVTEDVAVPGAAIVALPALTAFSGPIVPLVPGALRQAWWVPLAALGVVAAALAGETLGRRLLRAGRGPRDAVAVVAWLVVALTMGRLVASPRDDAPDVESALAAVPVAAAAHAGRVSRPPELRRDELELDGAQLSWRCGDACTFSLRAGPDGPTHDGARSLPSDWFAVAELDDAWIVAPAPLGASPRWRDGIAFSRETLEPTAIFAGDLRGPIALSPALTRSAIAGWLVALASLLVAMALRRRAGALERMREVHADEAGHVFVDGAILRTSPPVAPGPALIVAPTRVHAPTYRDEPGSVHALSGSRSERVEGVRVRVLALELVAIAAALAGSAPLLVAAGFVVASPF